MSGDYKKPLKIHIITLSDRAYRGIYGDMSGPKIKEKLEIHYKDTETEISSEIIPDEKDMLLKSLEKAVFENADLIFTTGGTGIGPRDITPEVVTEFADKIIPGIMDYIRIKYGQTIPNALISRSVAGIRNKTIIYSLPGSVKAVDEYMNEILITIDHLMLMACGESH